MTKSTSPQAAWVANDPLMLLQEKIFLNVTTVKKDLIIYNRVKHFTPNVNKMTMRENYVSKGRPQLKKKKKRFLSGIARIT